MYQVNTYNFGREILENNISELYCDGIIYICWVYSPGKSDGTKKACHLIFFLSICNGQQMKWIFYEGYLYPFPLFRWTNPWLLFEQVGSQWSSILAAWPNQRWCVLWQCHCWKCSHSCGFQYSLSITCKLILASVWSRFKWGRLSFTDVHVKVTILWGCFNIVTRNTEYNHEDKAQLGFMSFSIGLCQLGSTAPYLTIIIWVGNQGFFRIIQTLFQLMGSNILVYSTIVTYKLLFFSNDDVCCITVLFKTLLVTRLSCRCHVTISLAIDICLFDQIRLNDQTSGFFSSFLGQTESFWYLLLYEGYSESILMIGINWTELKPCKSYETQRIRRGMELTFEACMLDVTKKINVQ